MKYTAALVTALAAAASAQDISIFPECSLQCIVSGIGTTSCEATDFVCVCNNIQAITQAAAPCVVEKCGQDTALNKVLPATKKFCAEVGTGGGSSSSTGGGATPSTTKAPTTSTSTSTEEESPEPTTETEHPADHETTKVPSPSGSMVTPPPAGSSMPSTTSNTSAATTRPTSAVSTAGAPTAGYLGSLGMLVLGAVAAF